MIKLSQMNAGDKAVVVRIGANEELKQRFFSLGLHKGSQLQIKATSIAKSTMEIEVGTTLLALRYEEAKSIEVERV
ncbi:FeoA family protein [Sulfurospirillum diekertiae]|uniref:Fe(2+) transport protein A n=1 Tax=Sulfurospirillum diekertiae TaxID=1854492 RepID=A0A1Y0HPE6_9BACT|nr:FeoA family protein [Sulfurospirillum diekertiae]ARU49205.1 Putative Fe(2+) transport protein A [Sulfurospirillum diekertiae]ASC94015.1 Putative Fe(2+) transport protein A [Sulfurospirillum diekertiae]